MDSRIKGPDRRGRRGRRIAVALAAVAALGLAGPAGIDAARAGTAAAGQAAAQAATSSAVLTVTAVGTEAITVVGRRFPANGTVKLTVSPSAVTLPSATADGDGRFAVTALLPTGFSGTLTVTASASGSTATAAATVIAPVAGAPSAVDTMTVARRSSTELSLAWTAPLSAGSSAVKGYKIGWTEYGGSNRVWDSGSPHYQLSASPVTLINLVPGAVYTVRVTPFNAAGDGPTTTRTLSTVDPEASEPEPTDPGEPDPDPSESSGSGGSGGPGALPAKLLGGYWQMWQGPKVSEQTASAPQYNLHYAAFATSASGGVDGKLEFKPQFQSGDSLRADIAASRAAGKTWLLSIGGGGNDVQLRTSTHVSQMVNSLIPIIDSYHFDGIDFDLECGSECWNATSMKAVAQQLVDHYGSQFVISAAPRPYEDIYRDAAVKMGDLLDLFGYQFYDAEEFNDPDFLSDNINYRIDQAVEQGIPASKIMIGAITYSKYEGGHNTPQVYANIFSQVQKRYPALRGAFLWETSLDKKENWSFAKVLGKAVLGS